EDLDPQSIIMPDTTAIWDGNFSGTNSGNGPALVRYDGSNFGSSKVGLLNTGNGELDYLFNASFAFFDDPYTAGQNMDGSHFRRMLTGESPVFYLSYGPDAGPVRIWQPEFSNSLDTYSFPAPIAELDFSDLRRTVSAMTAWSNTSVGLIADLEGDYSY